MIRRFARPALCLALWIAPQAASAAASANLAEMPAGTYTIDKTHSTITAKLMHMGFSHYTMRFLGFTGAYSYDPQHPAASTLNVTINPASIDTATGSDAFGKDFDAELAGPGWLETEKFPTATFVSTAVDIGDGHTGKVIGDLTLHGVTKPVTLDVTFNGSGPSVVPGVLKSGFSATTVIKRSDFGVAKLVPAVGDEVTLNIELEFAKK